MSAGASLTLLERPYPQWPLSRVLHLLYESALNLDELIEFARLPLVRPPVGQ